MLWDINIASIKICLRKHVAMCDIEQSSFGEAKSRSPKQNFHFTDT
jgi:hypothetical protein